MYNGVAVWILVFLVQGGGGESGAIRGKIFSDSEQELCKQAGMALSIDPEVLAVSECQRTILVPTQVKK